MQAEARQRQFEQSAVGKATTKAVREAKKKPSAQTRPEAQQESNARDWLS